MKNDSFTFINRKGTKLTIDFSEITSHSFSNHDGNHSCRVKLHGDREITFTDSKATEFEKLYSEYLAAQHVATDTKINLDDL